MKSLSALTSLSISEVDRAGVICSWNDQNCGGQRTCALVRSWPNPCLSVSLFLYSWDGTEPQFT